MAAPVNQGNMETLGVEEMALRQLDLNMVYTFSYSGLIAVEATGLRLYNDTAENRKIKMVRASLGSPATGQGVYIDILQNGVSIFDTERGDYPPPNSNPRVYIFPDGDTAVREPDGVEWEWTKGNYLTVSIEQVGTTFAGADLTINVVVEE